MNGNVNYTGCAEACAIAPIKHFWLNALLYFAERDASPLKAPWLRAANLE